MNSREENEGNYIPYIQNSQSEKEDKGKDYTY